MSVPGHDDALDPVELLELAAAWRAATRGTSIRRERGYLERLRRDRPAFYRDELDRILDEEARQAGPED